MNNEIKVGILVIAAIIVFILAGVFIGALKFGEKGYELKILFNYVGDLKVGAPVIYAGGLRIGKVKDISIAENQLAVNLIIADKYRIRSDSDFVIYTMGLMGDKYVEVETYNTNQSYLEEGATIVRLGQAVLGPRPV